MELHAQHAESLCDRGAAGHIQRRFLCSTDLTQQYHLWLQKSHNSFPNLLQLVVWGSIIIKLLLPYFPINHSRNHDDGTSTLLIWPSTDAVVKFIISLYYFTNRLWTNKAHHTAQITVTSKDSYLATLNFISSLVFNILNSENWTCNYAALSGLQEFHSSKGLVPDVWCPETLTWALRDSVLHGGKQQGGEAKKMPKHPTHLPIQDLCPYCIEKVIYPIP